MQQYLFVSQAEPLVEIFTRTAVGFWRLAEGNGLDGVASLPSGGVAMAMAIGGRVMKEYGCLRVDSRIPVGRKERSYFVAWLLFVCERGLTLLRMQDARRW